MYIYKDIMSTDIEMLVDDKLYDLEIVYQRLNYSDLNQLILVKTKLSEIIATLHIFNKNYELLSDLSSIISSCKNKGESSLLYNFYYLQFIETIEQTLIIDDLKESVRFIKIFCNFLSKKITLFNHNIIKDYNSNLETHNIILNKIYILHILYSIFYNVCDIKRFIGYGKHIIQLLQNINEYDLITNIKTKMKNNIEILILKFKSQNNIKNGEIQISALENQLIIIDSL